MSNSSTITGLPDVTVQEIRKFEACPQADFTHASRPPSHPGGKTTYAKATEMICLGPTER